MLIAICLAAYSTRNILNDTKYRVETLQMSELMTH